MEKPMDRIVSHVNLLYLMVITLIWGGVAVAAEPKDQAALQGLNEAKIVFDITEGNGKALLTKLDVIDETRQSLIEQGVVPHFVLTFRSGATFFMQTDMDKIKPEDQEYASKIVAKLQEISKAQGVESLEQCNVAMRLTKVTADKILPEIKVVGNGWISLMGYQSRGYAYIQP